MKFIWITFEGIGLSIAKKLQEEGNEVIVGQIASYKELGIDKDEDPEDTEKRLKTFDGIIEKVPFKKLLKQLADYEDKNSWSVVCDFNNQYVPAEQLKALGFAGEECTGFVFLPTKEQYTLESDRDKAKQFVKEHYNLEVGECHDFKTVDDGIKFLQESGKNNKLWVLKAYNDDLNAIVPTSEDPMLAKDELISALVSERAGYEMQGYLLEEKIAQPMELTPQCVFYNGEPVFYDLDIETKPLLAGDTGPQTGCATNLVMQISEFDEICDMAFAPIVYDMAQQHKGMFIWDASILIDGRTGKKYFGEFCSNRWGWDSFFTELAMCESVTSYFENVMQGVNPLTKQFGASVRMFNIKKKDDMPIIFKDDQRDFYMYDVHQVKDQVCSIGYSWDLIVSTGSGDTLDTAVDNAYERMKDIAFTGGGYKPKFDFLSQDYGTSLISRYNNHVGTLFMGDKYESKTSDQKVLEMEQTLEKLKTNQKVKEAEVQKKFAEIQTQLIAALNDGE